MAGECMLRAMSNASFEGIDAAGANAALRAPGHRSVGGLATASRFDIRANRSGTRKILPGHATMLQFRPRWL
jgi:hypothetical protein